MFEAKILFSFLLALTVFTHSTFQYGTYLPLGSQGREAVCILQPASTSTVTGEIRLFQRTDAEPVQVMGHVQNLTPGAHGFHLHNEGSLADDCKGAGPHFNPLNQPHGGPQDLHRHAGDFGNILADEAGQAIFHLVNDQVSLVPGNQFYGVGRAFVVHEKQDDLGRGGNPESLKTGNAGSRLACCVVQPVGY